jgi:hypothetical protein
MIYLLCAHLYWAEAIEDGKDKALLIYQFFSLV